MQKRASDSAGTGGEGCRGGRDAEGSRAGASVLALARRGAHQPVATDQGRRPASRRCPAKNDAAERVAKFNVERIDLRILPALRVRPTKSYRKEDRDDHLIRKKTCGASAGR